jgi:RNA-directed DNA polymerase
MDLSKFFDSVNHDALMHRVTRRVRDRRVLKLIGAYLRAGVMVKGRLQETRTGVPQGGPLSPLLANIMLDDLDRELEKRGHRFARYADDFIIVVKSTRAAGRVMASVVRFVEHRLKLRVNAAKSRVAKVGNAEFLGFTFKAGHIRWSEAAFKEFKRRIKLLTGRSWFVSMQYRMEKIAQYVRGWMNYYGISRYYRPIPEVDEWLRRRVRMCYWKQWRYCRTKVRNLLRLGTYLRTAICAGISRKGPWRLSRTLATQSGMTNAWLKNQGLVSVKELWVKIHFPATARNSL